MRLPRDFHPPGGASPVPLTPAGSGTRRPSPAPAGPGRDQRIRRVPGERGSRPGAPHLARLGTRARRSSALSISPPHAPHAPPGLGGRANGKPGSTRRGRRHPAVEGPSSPSVDRRASPLSPGCASSAVGTSARHSSAFCPGTLCTEAATGTHCSTVTPMAASSRKTGHLPGQGTAALHLPLTCSRRKTSGSRGPRPRPRQAANPQVAQAGPWRAPGGMGGAPGTTAPPHPPSL